MQRATVIMPIFDQTEDRLYRAMLSIYGQTYFKSGHMDIIFILDGANKDTRDAVRRIFDANAHLGRMYGGVVRLMERSGNEGIAATLNEGYALTRTPLVTWAQSDNYHDPEWIEVLAQYMEVHASCRLAVAPTRFLYESGDYCEWAHYHDFSERTMTARDLVQNGSLGFGWLYYTSDAREIGARPEMERAEDFDFFYRLLRKIKKAECIGGTVGISYIFGSPHSYTSRDLPSIIRASSRVFQSEVMRDLHTLGLFPLTLTLDDIENQTPKLTAVRDSQALVTKGGGAIVILLIPFSTEQQVTASVRKAVAAGCHINVIVEV